MISKSIILLFSFSSLAFAEINPKALDTANDLAEILGLTNQLEQGFDAMMPLIEQQVKQLNLNDEQEAELKEIYKTWYVEDIDHKALAKDIVKIYAETFTAEELEQLIIFYRTPIGQKTLKIFPELFAKDATLGAAEAQKKQAKLLERLQPFFEAIGR